MQAALLTRNKLRLPSANQHYNPHSLCKLCDIDDWNDSLFSDLAGDIFARHALTPVVHRKLWEFTKTIQALKAGGVLKKNSLGLSVAGGTERILFYLANYVSRIIATDIYGYGNFSGNEASADFLTQQEKYAPYHYPKENLKAAYMNALELKFSGNLFDFAFCLSSIEHFGGLRSAKKALLEMTRVVRPGGIVFITTDCCLNRFRTHEVFSPTQIERLINDCDLELLEPIDWALSNSTLEHIIDMRKDNLATLPHINLKLFGSIFTSISLALRKRGQSSSIENNDFEDRVHRLDYEIEKLNRSKLEVTRSLSTTPKPLAWAQQKSRGLLYRIHELLM